MATSMEKSDVVKSSDTYEEVSNPCQPCSFHGKVVSSDRFCIDCQEYLCGSCRMHHTASKASRNHKLVAINEAKNSPPEAAKDKCSMKCTVHKDKTVKYFCKTHSFLGCSICFMMDHKNCNDVEHIPTVAEKVENRDEFKQFDEKLKAIEAACKAGISDVKKNLKAIETDHGQLKDAMHHFKKQVIDALDKLGNELMAEAGIIMCEEKNKLDDLSKKMSKHQADAYAIIKQADTLLSNGKKCDTFVLMKNEAKTLISLDEKIKETAKGQTIQRYTFQPNLDTLTAIAVGKLSCRQEGTIYGPVISVLYSPLDGDAMSKLLQPGTRVCRGKDWRWKNQDRGGLGTVVGPHVTGWFRVKWDHGKTDNYEVNARCCGLQLA